MAVEERNLSGFERRWLRLFAGGVSADMLKKYVPEPGNYIWHVFSWELLPQSSWLEGDEARKAFDAADKTGAKYHKPFAPPGSPAPKYHSPCAEDLDQLTEIYVIAADQS